MEDRRLLARYPLDQSPAPPRLDSYVAEHLDVVYEVETATHDEVWHANGGLGGSGLIFSLPNADGKRIELVRWDHVVIDLPEGGFEIWQTRFGPELLARVGADEPVDHDPKLITSYGGRLIIASQADGGGAVLWSVSRQDAGVTRLGDFEDIAGVNIEQDRSRREVGVELDGWLIFIATGDSGQQQQLWRTNGTMEGTSQVVLTGSPLLEVGNWATRVANRIFFAGRSEAHGWEVWATRGTDATTELVHDIWPGPEGSRPTAAWGPDFFLRYYHLDNPPRGESLWIDNEYSRTVEPIRDMHVTTDLPTRFQQFLMAGNTAYFTAAIDGSDEFGLWRVTYRDQRAELVMAGDVRDVAHDGTKVYFGSGAFVYSVDANDPMVKVEFDPADFYGFEDARFTQFIWSSRPFLIIDQRMYVVLDWYDGDFDGDGDVDSSDLLDFLSAWTGALEPGTGGATPFTGDYDFDQDVDSADLLLFFEYFNYDMAQRSAVPLGTVQVAEKLEPAASAEDMPVDGVDRVFALEPQSDPRMTQRLGQRSELLF